MDNENKVDSNLSAKEVAAYREYGEKLDAEAVGIARRALEDNEGNLNATLSPEDCETLSRINVERENVAAVLRQAEGDKRVKDFQKTKESMEEKASAYRERQAKLDAKFHQNLIDVGRGKFDGVDGAPALNTGQPLVAKDPVTGKNVVYPVPAVFTTDKHGQKVDNVEAGFRLMNIIQGDAFGKYDAFGNKIDTHNAPVGKEKISAELGTTAYTLTTQGGILYEYMIQVNELASYCKIQQTQGVNEFLVDVRTGIGNYATAGPLAQGSTIPNIDSSFVTRTIRYKKYGVRKGYNYELTNTMEPWDFDNLVLRDLGEFLGNTVGQHIVAGDDSVGSGETQQWNGFMQTIKDQATMQFTGVANASFLKTSSPEPGIKNWSDFMGSLPKEYWKKPSKKAVMSLATWTGLMGLTDGEDRKLYNSNMSLGELSIPMFNVGIVLDENVDDGNAANEIPIFYGDLESGCLAFFDGPRIDYSPLEAGYETDRLYYRGIIGRGFEVIDYNALRGYEVQ